MWVAEKKQSIEIGPDVAQILQLADKIKASIVNLLLKTLVQNNYSEWIEDMETKKAKKIFLRP